MTPRRAVVELELISRIDQDGDCTETRTFARGELTRLRDSVTLAYREPDGGSRTQIRFFRSFFTEVDAACQFSDNDDIQPAFYDFRFKRTRLSQFIEQQCRTEICEKPQSLPQPQQSSFRALIAWESIPLPAAYGAKKHCITSFADINGLLREAFAFLIDGAAACQYFCVFECVSEFRSDFIQNF